MPKPLYTRPAPAPPKTQFEWFIYLLRGQKVMLDSDLAALYGVSTKVLNQAVRRNVERFPKDFMFRLSVDELELLRSQIVTLKTRAAGRNAEKAMKSMESEDSLRSQTVTLKRGGHRKYAPFVFTEQGVAMLSSVLRSARAVKVNVEIMRTFVRLRQLLASHGNLERRLSELELKCDRKFRAVFDAIRDLMERPEPLQPEHGREIGFHPAARLKEEPPPYRCFGSKSVGES